MIRCFTFFLLLFSTLSYSQFSNFDLQVTPSGVTCAGMDDGVLTVAVDGITDDTVSVEYLFYKEPDLTTPYHTVTVGSEGFPEYEYVLEDLAEGDYQVHAVQKLGTDESLPQIVMSMVEVGPEGVVPCFTFTIVPGDETCPGKGTLTFNVSGADPSAIMSFQIYSLPSETLVSTHTTELGEVGPYTYVGVAAGEYKVVATQYLGADSNWQVETATVEESNAIAEFCDFSLFVYKADLTCDINNGKIEVNVDGVYDAAVSVEYTLYKLPDMTTPVATVVVGPTEFPSYEHVFNSLGTGEYVVHAVQIKGAVLSDQEVWEGEIVLLDNLVIAPIVNSKCLGEAELLVNVVAGGADDLSYSLHQLPEGPGPGKPYVPYLGPSDTPVFSDLEPGWYRIFIQDSCGQDFPFDVEVKYIPLGDPLLVGSELEADFAAGCGAAKVKVTNTIQPPYDWILGMPDYPFTVDYYVFPPSEFPIANWPDCALLPDPEQSNAVHVTTHNVISGGAQVDLETMIPYYPGEGLYYYMGVITDDCGKKTYFCEIVDFELDLQVRLSPDYCYGVEVLVENFVGDYTIYFGYHPQHQNNPDVPTPGYPVGFAPPTVWNDDPNHPDYGIPHNGPFTGGSTVYGLDYLIQVELEPMLDDDGNPILDGDGNPVMIPSRDQDGQMIPILDADENTIPILAGEYWITVVDQCGITSEVLLEPSIVILEEVQEPSITTPMPAVNNTGIDLEYPVFSCLDIGNLTITHEINLKKVQIIDFVAAPGIEPNVYQQYLAHAERPRVEDELPPELYAQTQLPLDISAYIGYPDPTQIPEYTLLFPGLAGAGIYTIEITDICDNVWVLDMELLPLNVGDSDFSGSPQGPGCAEGLGSIHINTGGGDMGEPQEAYIISGPAEFEALYGHDFANGPFDVLGYVSDFEMGDGTIIWQIIIADLPAGDYTFNIDLVCNPTDYHVTIESYQEITEIELGYNCGTFNLTLNHWANNFGWSTPNESYSLELYNEDTGDWEFVMNLLVDYYFEGGGEPDDGVVVSNNGISYQGLFRVVKTFRSYENGEPQEPKRICTVVLGEPFDFLDRPEIEEVYYTTCPDGETEVVVVAIGADPMTYQIWTEDTIFDDSGNAIQGELIMQNPEGNNIFVGVEPGTYIFRVIDGCGGTAFKFLTVEDEISFEVQSANLCEGQLGYLFVENYSFLEYEWYNTNDPANILSTSSQLAFNPFEADVHQGTYVVNISFPANPNSCINHSIEFEVEVDLPNAGVLEDQILCPQTQELDLFTLFTSSDHDLDGKWEDIDNTGELDGDTGVLQVQSLSVGTYNFRYYVESSCAGEDEAFVQITILAAPEKPEITVDLNGACVGETVMLSVVDADAAYTYVWTLPNGNTYQGETIEYTEVALVDAGSYTVSASIAGQCSVESDPFVLDVKELPDFVIAGNTVICIGQSTILTVQGANFQNSDASFVWYFNNAEISSVTTSSIDAADLGEYGVMVTVDGCEFYQSVVVTEKTDVPAIDLSAGCEENNYIIAVVNTQVFPNATYEWTGPDGFFSTDTSINVTGLPLGIYEVTVTDADGCKVYNAEEVLSTECMIPKGVSPNGDGMNDTFDLSNFNVSNLQIFNRYGRVVYEANDYTNQWYGQTTDDSELLPSATYYYVITFVGGDKKTGWVYLNREK